MNLEIVIEIINIKSCLLYSESLATLECILPYSSKLSLIRLFRLKLLILRLGTLILLPSLLEQERRLRRDRLSHRPSALQKPRSLRADHLAYSFGRPNCLFRFFVACLKKKLVGGGAGDLALERGDYFLGGFVVGGHAPFI